MRQIFLLTLLFIGVSGTRGQTPVPVAFPYSCEGVVGLNISVDPAKHTVRIHERISDGTYDFVYLSKLNLEELTEWILHSKYLVNDERYVISKDCAKVIAEKAKDALGIKDDPPPPYPTSGLHLDGDTTLIYTRVGNKEETRVIAVRLSRDSVPPKEKSIKFSFKLISSTAAYAPTLQPADYEITKDQWQDDPKTKKKTCTVLLKMTNPLADEVDSATVHIVIDGGDASYHLITLKESLPRSPNFFVGSFIKSIAGSALPKDELVDLLVKVNLRGTKAMNRHLLFGMMGADAGVKDTASLISLNEAVVNVNWAINKTRPTTHRLGFLGGGLKVFNHEAYFGGHVGLMELTGILQSTYILAGYYYSPWLGSVSSVGYKADTLHRFRHNLYFEAAFNAFGDNAPKALQFIRLKFGLMLPIAVGSQKDGVYKGDQAVPRSFDFMYRLAIEVPIGGPIKF